MDPDPTDRSLASYLQENFGGKIVRCVSREEFMGKVMEQAEKAGCKPTSKSEPDSPLEGNTFEYIFLEFEEGVPSEEMLEKYVCSYLDSVNASYQIYGLPSGAPQGFQILVDNYKTVFVTPVITISIFPPRTMAISTF